MAGVAAPMMTGPDSVRRAGWPRMPGRPVEHSVVSYGLAVVLVAAAAGLLWWPVLGLARAGVFLLFLPVVVLCAWQGGLGPGLTATVLGATVGCGILIPPANSLGVETPAGLLNLLVFLSLGGGLSVLCEQIRDERTVARRTAENLTVSEDRWRQVLETAEEGICILDRGGAMEVTNARFREMLGVQPEEVRGKNITEFLVPDEQQEGFWSACARGEAAQSAWALQREDGVVVQAQVRSGALRDEAGAVIGTLASFTDVTEGLRLREELQEASRRILTIVNHLHEGFVALDHDGRVTFANPTAQGLFGRPLSLLQGEQLWEVCDDLRDTDFAQHARSVLDGAGEIHALIRHLATDLWVEHRFQPYGDGLFVFSTDVTAAQWPMMADAARSATRNVLVEAASLRSAAPRFLAAAAEPLGWDAACLWLVDFEERVLRGQEVWSTEGFPCLELRDQQREMTLRPGIAIVGKAWNSETSHWLEDTGEEPYFLRQVAYRTDGLQSLVAIPLRRGSRILGVLEFLSRVSRQQSEAMLHLLEDLANQFAQFLEKEQADLDRQAAEARFRRLLRGVAVPMALGDAGGTVRDASDGFCRLLGYDRADLRPGRTTWSVLTPPAATRLDEVARAQLSEPAGRSRAVEWLRKDGTPVPVRMTATPVDGEAIDWIVVGVDDTELQLVANAGESAFVALTPGLETRWANARFQDWFPSDGGSDTWLAAAPDAIREWLEPLVRQAQSGIRRATEGTVVHPVLGLREVSASAIPQIGPGGKVTGVLLRLEDRTVRLRAQMAWDVCEDVSRALSAGLPPLPCLREAAQRIPPRLADWCVLTLVDDRRRPIHNIAFHENAARAEFLERVLRSFPILSPEFAAQLRPYETGDPELCEQFSEAAGQIGIWDPSHRETLDRLGFQSNLCVPMRVGERIIGALTLVMAESGRRFSREDLPYALDLALRLAGPLEAAR